MDYEIIVIGGGPAGYVAAIKAAKLGKKVAIVEKDQYGGTCLNRGCIPTKDFLKNVEIIKNIKKAKKRGVMIENDNFTIDIQKIVAHKNSTVKMLTGGVEMLLKNNKVTMYAGVGKLKADKTVEIYNEAGEKTAEIKAPKVILAGGSKIKMIGIKGIDNKLVYTSDTILDITEIPESLAVIGGGVIGCEMSQVFSAFGSKVTIVEAMDRILPMADEEISKTLHRSLKRDGIDIKTSQFLQEIIEENGKLKLVFKSGEEIIADRALLSIGRESDLEAIEGLDIKTERGSVVVDEYMMSSMPDVYSVGDMNGKKMLAHAAFKMGEVAAENACGEHKEKVDLRYVPSVIYTLPEVAFIGMSEAEAKEREEAGKGKINIGKFNFGANGRAIASDEKDGFVKVISDAKYGEILGVHMIGPCVSELINEVVVLMQSEITVQEMLKSIHAHPSYSEVTYEAFADTLSMAIHK